MQQLFHVGDDDSGWFLQKSWGDDDCDGDDGDGDGSDNSDDGGDDDAIGVEKGVASCDKVTARSCRDGKSCQRWRIADSKAWLIVVEEASSVKSGKSS